jgi:hypothetical protein
MFLGHYAAALGVKRIAPAASLGTLPLRIAPTCRCTT